MSTVGAEVGEQMERAEDASSPQELLCDNFFRGSVRREKYSPVCWLARQISEGGRFRLSWSQRLYDLELAC